MNQWNKHIFSKNTFIHTWPNETESFVPTQWIIWWLIMMLCLCTNHHSRSARISISFDNQVCHSKRKYPCLVTIYANKISLSRNIFQRLQEKGILNISTSPLYLKPSVYIFLSLLEHVVPMMVVIVCLVILENNNPCKLNDFFCVGWRQV